jgi:hypothetical protein
MKIPMNKVWHLTKVLVIVTSFALCAGCSKSPNAEALKPQIEELIKKGNFEMWGPGYGGWVKFKVTEVVISGISEQGAKALAKTSVKMKPESWERTLHQDDFEDTYSIEETYEFQKFDSGWQITTKPPSNTELHSKKNPK